MPKANLTKETMTVIDGRDGIIVRKHVYGIEAGRVLDVTDYNYDVVPCGTPVIKKLNGNEMVYKALVPTEGFVLPSGWSYAGIAAASVKKGQACPILVGGMVNEVALIENMKDFFPTPDRAVTIDDLAAIKAALPHIVWMSDECSDVAVTLTNVQYIYDATTWAANKAMLDDYYETHPDAAGADGTYPNIKWVVANFSNIAGTLVITYDGQVKTEVPGITTSSTYIIIDPLTDLNIQYASFDLTKLVLTVKP